METNKFVIWGTGERGTIISDFLGKSQIIAYIDSDIKKQGSFYLGCPVISFDEYRRKFSGYFIIVTPVDEGMILEELKAYNVNSFFRMSHLPSEMQGYGDKDFLNKINISLIRNGRNVLVGANLYSYVLYKKIMESGYHNVFVFSKEKAEVATLMNKMLKCNIINQIDNENDNLILTTPEKKKAKQYFKRDITDLFDLSELIPQYYNQQMEVFRNFHKGKRCFIVATGPSLRTSDLKVLTDHGEICFGVNRVFNVERSVWKPQYYIFVDRAGMKKYWKQISAYDVNEKFLGDSYWKDIDYKGNIHVIHTVTGHSYHVPPEFSENLERKVYIYSTVTYVAIQLAVYMGFKKIYLLGVDCNYQKNSKNNYFFKDENIDSYNHYEDRMIASYKVAKEYADLHGIKIMNASRGGMLEEFERVNFEDIFHEN